MDTTAEFKQKIRAGEISEAITLAMSEALELKISTRTDNQSSNNQEYSSDNCLQTNINMIEGRIENEVGQNLIENGSYDQVKEFHLALVKQGSYMILKNMESLQKMFAILNETLPYLPEESLNPSSALSENNSTLYLSEENP